ncbi:MAG: response regulator [Candidatus Latescibacteria bacterium]|nr:response regulator [Candidatus Latescibacterota bacterium]
MSQRRRFAFPVVIGWIAALWSAVSAPSARAHNGAVAIAVPVAGIRVDGDLSDWPDDIPETAITHTEYGDAPTGEGDLSGWLRVAYEGSKERLYLGVRVRDESLVIDRQNPGSWSSQDGCELYLDLGHGAKQSPASQYTFYGDHVGTDAGAGVERGWQRTAEGYQYEWALDLGRLRQGQAPLSVPRSLGFDLSLGDRDADGSFSWVAWGPGPAKLESVDRRGDLLLVASGAGSGRVHGRISWPQGQGLVGAAVRLQSVPAAALWAQVKTDARGEYRAELPTGRYRVSMGPREAELDLRPGEEVRYSFELPAPRGREVPLGPGKTTAAGVGTWRQDWQNYSMQDGLPDDAVSSLCQSGDGVLWIATANGHLTEFDGEAFTTYAAADGLPPGVVRALAADGEGALWFGTDAGNLARLHDGRLTLFSAQDGLPVAPIQTLLFDEAGTLWIGTQGGLVRFDGKSILPLTVADGLSANAVKCLARAAKGGIWIGTPVGLNYYDGNTFRKYSVSDGLSSNDICTLLVDADSTLWVGTAGGGINRFEGERFVAARRIGERLRISGLLEDGRGRRWIGTSLDGLYLDEGGSLTQFGDNRGLVGTVVNCLLIDREGTLWVGTHDAGLSRYEMGRLQTYRAGIDLPESRVTRLLQDRRGALWIATAGDGLVRWEGSARRVFTTSDGLGNNAVWVLLEDRDGVLWVGTEGGVSRLVGERFVRLATPEGLPPNTWALLQDHTGAVWIGAQGGLARYHEGRFDLYGAEDGLVYADARCLMEDRQGDVWIGTIYGLSRYHEGRFTSFTTADGLAHDDVRSLLEARDGQIWVATQAGVSRYDGSRFANLTVQEGLVSNDALALLEDRAGTVWIGANGGVGRFDGEVVQTLLPRDGLASRSAGALLQDLDGRIWIGGRGGLTRYEPAPAPPTVLLTEVMTDRPYGPQTAVRIPSTQRFLAFDFRGVSLKTRPEGMVYRYRLGGPETPWQTTRRRRVEFTDLEVGDYTFEVQAVSRDLGRSVQNVRTLVAVHPPYGQIGLWSLLCLTLVGLAGAGAKLVRRNRQVRTQEARFRNLLELAPDAVIVVDRDGRIVLVNAQTEKMFDYRREELLGEAVEVLLPEPFRQSHVGHRAGFVAEAQTRQMGGERVFSGRRKDGQVFPIEVGLSSLATDEGMLAFANVRDVSERERVQRELEKAREAAEVARGVAEAASQAKADFLANMSHEIRTPMNAIIGMAHLALRTKLDPKQQDYLDKIQRSGQHLLGIINDILDFSKIEAGKLDVETVDFALDKVLDNLASLIGEKAAAKGLELIFDLDPGLPNDLRGDPLRLGQVLINYANNAVKFTEKGEIVVRIRKVEETEAGFLARFEVQDSGIGLTPEQKARLFQAFQQADTSTTRKFGGTGLGLAISKRLTELMGGEVGVESEAGQGSTFWFTARLGRGEAKKRILLPEPDLRNRRLLVVEDNPQARQILTEMLESMAFRVDEVDSGEKALSAISEAETAGDPFHLVFLDWRLPGIDGIETARRIAAAPLKNPPHRVMVTAYGREEVFREAEGMGIEIVLVKPVNPSILFDAVVRALGGELVAEEGGPTQRGMGSTAGDLESIKGARVLLVEDNELNQQVAMELLAEGGLAVELAENGEVALRLVGEKPYDAVLMDMQMPVMDGLTAAREIRKDHRFAKLPILAMTANAMAGDRDKCLEAGMNDRVAKPIDPEVLFATLLRWIPARHPQGGKETMASAAPAATVVAAGSEATDPLAAIPGLDAAAALRRLLNKRPMYERLLRQFAGEQAGAVGLVRAQLAAGDAASAERSAHSLKGMAGTLGAGELQARAARLEQGIKQGMPADELSTCADQAEAELVRLVGALQMALPPEAATGSAAPPPDLDWVRAKEVVGQLETLLEADDAAAIDLFEQEAGLLQAALGTGGEPVGRALQDWNLVAALEALRRARAAVAGLS